MTFAKPTPKQESAFDEVQRLMCSVPGCPNCWTVHISGDKPKCSKHQWEKNPSDYKKPVVANPVSQTVQQWYEREDF